MRVHIQQRLSRKYIIIIMIVRGTRQTVQEELIILRPTYEYWCDCTLHARDSDKTLHTLAFLSWTDEQL
jgi:hypothetical protein